jgi:hypothetical protein
VVDDHADEAIASLHRRGVHDVVAIGQITSDNYG